MGKRYLPFFFYFLIVFLVYNRCATAGFILVDDYGGFVENEAVLRYKFTPINFNIPVIVNAIIYQLFGINSTAMHVFSIIVHGISACLVYLLYLKTFKKPIVAFFSGLIFLLHPVNNEAVCWTSGRAYLYLTLFCLITLLSYKKYYVSLGFFTASLLVFRNPWMATIPFLLVIFDQLVARKKIDTKLLYKHLPFFYVLPVLLVFGVYGPASESLPSRMSGGNLREYFIAEKVSLGQELLMPVVEGYPFSVYSMIRLYLFPKTLMFYYEGNSVGIEEKVLMYLVFFIFLGGLWYLFVKQRKLFGLAVLVFVGALYVFSPVKITWFVAERYFYLGSVFFSGLMAYGLEKILKNRNVYVVAVLSLVFLYGLRTYVRSGDWVSAEAHARATIRTSPLGYRGWLDLGGSYFMDRQYTEALGYFYKSMDYFESVPAKNDIGLVMLNGGPGYLSEIKKYPPVEEMSAKDCEDAAEKLLLIGKRTTAVYFITEAIKKGPSAKSYNMLAQIYLSYNLPDFASETVAMGQVLFPEDGELESTANVIKQKAK